MYASLTPTFLFVGLQAHLLLLCHVLCLFLSGRACVKGGNKAEVYALCSSPSKTEFTSTAKPLQTQRLNGNKDAKVPLPGGKTRATEMETRMKMFPNEGYFVKENEDDLVKLTRAHIKSPRRGMPRNKIDKHDVRTEESNEGACADSSAISNSSKQQSRDASLDDSTPVSASSVLCESDDLRNSESSGGVESPKKRRKVRKLQAV